MRLPLGQAYQGLCHAANADPPTGARLKLCNLGYARGRCDRFPPAHDVDANRFSRAADGSIVWIEEADHAPLRFASATEIGLNRVAQQQLRAFQQQEEP